MAYSLPSPPGWVPAGRLFVLLLAMSALARASPDYSQRLPSCTIFQGPCQYQVSVTGTNCMSQDAPSSFETIINEAKKTNAIEVEEMKRLEELERKLTKMMEGLSIRSLRHIRQIRNDLREMSTTMNLLKHQGNKRRRGSTCPPEFTSVGTWTSCYRFSTFNATWHEAREYCAAFGADLVSPDTMKEAYIMDYLIKSNPDFEEPKGWWTSGNYIARNRKWMWTTKHHLRDIKYSRWAPGEPDARSTMHCMLMYKNARYMWHDATCTDKHNFICEIELM